MNTFTKTTSAILLTTFYANLCCAAESTINKDHQTRGTTSLSNQVESNIAPVEHLGFEKGPLVDAPADFADKIGTKINNLFGIDQGKDQASTNTETAHQTTKQPNEAPVEPLGLEKGTIVDGPANLTDKIGNKINSFLGNDT